MIDLVIKDNILIATFPKGLELNIDIAMKVVEDRKKLQDGKKHPLLAVLNDLKSNSKAVREFMANEGTEGITRIAFLVKNLQEKIYINFFLMIDSPGIPTKVCYDEKEAITWLKSNS